jgi:acyl carrier protein
MSTWTEITKQLNDLLLDSLDTQQYSIESLGESLTPTTNLIECGIDSLNLMEYLLRVEQHFGLEIPEDEYDQMVSMAAIERYILNAQ